MATNDTNNEVQQFEKPMTLKESAQYLGISESCLYKKTSQKRIPHYKPDGKIIYFKRKDLDEFAFSKLIKTIDEIEAEAIRRVGLGKRK